MLEGILQGLFQWIYGLFLDLITFCANALLGVMSTDLEFWETSVPVVTTLYGILTAVGWGLLIGNLAFQSMKAMFAGLGLETESPAILMLRTVLFGTLLMFSKDICDIGLSIAKNVIELMGIPDSVTITTPEESMFGSLGAAWLLVIIMGFIIGFQIIKLFFEIAERYVVVAVLTLLFPVGLAMGASKSTKDICTGYIRTYASMVVMMVMNVLFLKLILSALATMPADTLVLPWCLLVVGIARTARKADNLVSKIGMSPAVTGDPLGHGNGRFVALMAARTIMSSVSRSGSHKGASNRTGGSNSTTSTHYGGNSNSNVRNKTGGTNVGGSTVRENSAVSGAGYSANAESNTSSQRNTQNSSMAGSRNTANTQSSSTVRFGSGGKVGANTSVGAASGRTQFGSSGKSRVNKNRFGANPGTGKNGTAANATTKQNTDSVKNTRTGAQNSTASNTAKQNGKGRNSTSDAQKTAKRTAATTQKSAVHKATGNASRNRFGAAGSMGGVRHNANPMANAKPAIPKAGVMRTVPDTVKESAVSDNIEATDTAKEVLKDINPKEGNSDE